jgi:sortase (surface protein transpeptidase)
MGGSTTMIRRIVAPFLGVALGVSLVASGILLSRPPTAPARADEIAAASPSPSAEPAAAQAAVATPPPTATASPLGSGWRIKIARIGIDLPLKDGEAERDITDQATPDGAAYRLAGSALPGTPGNAYIYGHARWAQFIGLWYAHLDDLIVITGPGTTLYYRVTEIHPRVPTGDITYLLPTVSERLTLQTSSGPNSDDPRFVVIAEPAR